MVVFTYENWWKKVRNKPSMAGLVNSMTIPAKLEINATWMGMMMYDDKLKAARDADKLYVGVIASHRSGHFLIHVRRPKKNDPPKHKIATDH